MTARSWWEEMKQSFEFQGTPTDGYLTKGQESAQNRYGINLPESYLNFLDVFGPGTIGNFLEIVPSHWMDTFGERMEVSTVEVSSYLDEDLDSMKKAASSGDILIFASTANGDHFGWHLSALRSNPDPEIVRIFFRSHECEVYAATLKDFIEQIVNSKMIAGVGPLPLSYKPYTVL